jgi:hypothetical protein
MSEVAPTIICTQCKGSSPSGASFCSNCGKPLASSENYQIPETGYAVEFADSTAANFAAALEKAKRSFGYETCMKGRKRWHLAIFNGDQFSQVTELAESLEGIRNRKVYVNGKEEGWWDVFAFLSCATRRKTSYKPAEYCFGVEFRQLNLWGCAQLSMELNDWAVWLTCGSFQKTNQRENSFVWIFDKQRILHELNNKLFRFRYCPHLNSNLIQTILELLPNEIEVSPASDEWCFRSSSEKVPGSVIIYESHGEPGDGVSWSSTSTVFGIQPRGNKFAIRILKEAFCRCGINEPKVDDFLN